MSPSSGGQAEGGPQLVEEGKIGCHTPGKTKPILDLLETAIRQTYDGSLDPKKAHAMASLAGAVVKVMEAGVFEERLLKLERRLDGKRYQIADDLTDDELTTIVSSKL